MHHAARSLELRPPSELEILHADGSLVVGAFRNVHLTVYRGPMSVETLDVADRHHAALKRRHPSGTVALGITPIELPMPPPEVRAHASALIRRNAEEKSVLGSAIVLPGRGFWASAARSAMTAIFVVARQPYPSRIFATVDEAAVFCCDLGSHGREPVAALVGAVRALETTR